MAPRPSLCLSCHAFRHEKRSLSPNTDLQFQWGKLNSLGISPEHEMSTKVQFPSPNIRPRSLSRFERQFASSFEYISEWKPKNAVLLVLCLLAHISSLNALNLGAIRIRIWVICISNYCRIETTRRNSRIFHEFSLRTAKHKKWDQTSGDNYKNNGYQVGSTRRTNTGTRFPIEPIMSQFEKPSMEQRNYTRQMAIVIPVNPSLFSSISLKPFSADAIHSPCVWQS